MFRKIIIKEEFPEMVSDIVIYISKNSRQNAIKFNKGINPKLDIIADNPLGYPKLFIFKTGDYRFCNYMKSWKIIFRINRTHLVFLGIVHSARHQREIIKLK